jgi:hypothetical protein
MPLGQELLQQSSGPDGRAIAQLSWVSINDRFDQRVNDPECRARATTPLTVSNAGSNLKVGSRVKASDPVIDALAGDSQPLGDLFDAIAFVEPEQGLRTLPLPEIASRSQQMFQEHGFSGTEIDQYHRFTSFSTRKGDDVMFVKELLSNYLILGKINFWSYRAMKWKAAKTLDPLTKRLCPCEVICDAIRYLMDH